MHKPLAGITVLFALVASASAENALAGETAHSPAEIAAQRQEILADMLTDKYEDSWIADLRRLCAKGGEPASVAEDRGEGAYFTPDAADSCVTALVRTAHNRRLPELYSKLLTELGGRPDAPEKLPHAIGAAVLSGNGKVAIGNGKAAVVTPALAFDAGFSVGFEDGPATKAPSADARQLKALAETCMAQRQDAGTCFSAGYVYGAQAVRTNSASAR